LWVAVGAVMGVGATNVSAAISRGPVISPSVKQAHRLKYNPPRGWIRHYLGDDRYKIGATWRVVTTPNDKFYYPPFAREMLLAPADKIIGFSSAQDAQEAGYAPAPAYGEAFGLDAHQMATEDLRSSEEPSSGAGHKRNVTTINRTPRAVRIILADGASSVLLPNGWRRTRTQRRDIKGNQSGQTFTVFADELRPITGTSLVGLFSMRMPNGMNLEPYVRPQAFTNVLNSGNKAGLVSGIAGVNSQDISVSRAALNGLSGIKVTPKNGVALMGEANTRMIVVARGSKMYGVLYRTSKRGADISSVVNSFRPR